MLNDIEINSSNLNYNTVIDNTTGDNSEIISSFSSSQTTKYAIKTPLGQYFNIWTFGTYESWICWVWKRIMYWNILLDTDVESLAKKEIESWDNPILNGWVIQGIRFSKKEIEFSIEIRSKDISNFEKEISSLKRALNYEGIKLIKKEGDLITELNIELDDIDVSKFSYKGTEVTINLLSLDPNFKKPSWNTKAYRNISGNLDIAILISDAHVAPYLNTLIDIKEIDWTITSIELEVDWYKVEMDCNIETSEKVVFNGKKSEIFVWNTEIEDFKGKFMPFPLDKPIPIKVNFIWATVNSYSIYFTYDNIYL